MKKVVVLLVLYSFIFSCKNKDSKSVEQIVEKSNSRFQPKVSLPTNINYSSFSSPKQQLPISTFPYNLKLIKPYNIRLEYKLVDYEKKVINQGNLEKNSKKIKCEIFNNNYFSLFLVVYSCSESPGHFVFEPNEFEDYQNFYCNYSWPMIVEIKPNKSYKFSTNLKINGKSKLKKLGLYVRFVDKMVKFEHLKQQSELMDDINTIPIVNWSYLIGKEMK